MVWLWFAIVAGTFVSEDAACIAAGFLIHEGKLPAWTGVSACFVGIYFGDLGLWAAGRLFGRRLLRWRWLAQRLPTRKLERAGHWLDRNAPAAILTSRFIPGSRLPLYLASGMLGKKAYRFFFWTFIAAGIWTPTVVLLVAHYGQRFVGPFQRVLGDNWLALAAAALVMFVLLRLFSLLLTHEGRLRLVVRISKLWRWEFWPAWLFYLPLLPCFVYWTIRYRGLTVFTAANPGLPHSGFVGESKSEILDRLAGPEVLPHTLIEPGDPSERLAAITEYPVILKPNTGQRGNGLRLIHNAQQALEHFRGHAPALIAQRFHPGPNEAGVFYIRPPQRSKGFIFSITHKVFPQVVGDGTNTLRELILRDRRLRMQSGTFLRRFADQEESVPARGQVVKLAVAGNHCQGTMFLDGSRLITPELEARIDAVAQRFTGFHFGRFDVRYTDEAAFKRGEDLAIIELNGVSSESTNLYDPSWSLFRAYRTLIRQWAWAYAIGDINRRRGARVSSLAELWRETRAHYRGRVNLPVAD